MPSALGVELGPRSRGSFSSSCVLVGMGTQGLLSPEGQVGGIHHSVAYLNWLNWLSYQKMSLTGGHGGQ